MDGKNPRVLLIAEAANPQWVSVPLEGWSHSQAIARRTDTHLVTHVRNRRAILEAGLVEGRDFTAIDSDRVVRPLRAVSGILRGGPNKGWTANTAAESLGYYYFEWLVWRRFVDELSAGEFDLVHRLTPLSPTAPSLLARWCARIDVPFVLGPLNGGVPWPRAFDPARRKEREWLSYVRGLHKLLPGYHATRRHAAAIVIGSQATWEQMPERYRERCVYIPENAIDPQRFDRFHQPHDPPLRAVFVGRLVPYKGPDMLIEAAAPLVRAGELRVDLIGDGPMHNELAAQIEREQLGDGVRLLGWVEHERLQERLSTYDLFTFPSIREFGGAVVLEAMALGVVPVVVDYGGPSELVTPGTGYLVPLGDRARIVERFRQTLAGIIAAPAELGPRREAGVRRVHRQFNWDAKAEQMCAVYQWVLGRGLKPDFGRPLPDDPSGAAAKVGAPAADALPVLTSSDTV